jgi:transposase
MRKIHAVLRLFHEAGLSQRAIGRSQKIGHGTVANYLTRAANAGLSWPLPPDMDERALELALFPDRVESLAQRKFSEPDFAALHIDLKSVGMTKQLAWEEYRQVHSENGYSYSQFCHRYRTWQGKQRRSMRQTHIAGEKVFVDYCGPTVPIVNAHDGTFINAQIFVAVLGASNYTFACAHASQKEADWIDAHIKAAQFFGGWSTLTIPDNLKSGVSKTDRYVPVLNASYEQWADHYRTAIIPARPYKPKDKSKAENGVLVVERSILARLRKRTFFSLGELNDAIAGLLTELNDRPFKKLPGCRRSLFEQIEKATLIPLPSLSYEYQHVKNARVHIDYHIEYDKHYYSVPHMLVGVQVEVRASTRMINVYNGGKRIACHARSSQNYGHTTLKEHMPEAHRHQADWTPERFEQWASDIGCATHCVVCTMLKAKGHPQQSFRSVSALLSLTKKYDRVRLENACARAMQIGSPTRTSVQSILKKGLDTLSPQEEKTASETNSDTHLKDHGNIRGAEYYH